MKKLTKEQKLDEAVQGFLNDLRESITRDFAEPFPISMSSSKIRKVASMMAGATGAGVP